MIFSHLLCPQAKCRSIYVELRGIAFPLSEYYGGIPQKDSILQMSLRIKALRTAFGHTQATLAQILDVSVNHYSQLERGSRPFSQRHLEILAVEFNCDVSELYDKPDTPPELQFAIDTIRRFLEDGDLKDDIADLMHIMRTLDEKSLRALVQQARLLRAANGKEIFRERR